MLKWTPSPPPRQAALNPDYRSEGPASEPAGVLDYGLYDFAGVNVAFRDLKRFST
jgi:hypothetical protein